MRKLKQIMHRIKFKSSEQMTKLAFVLYQIRINKHDNESHPKPGLRPGKLIKFNYCKPKLNLRMLIGILMSP